MVSIFSRRVLVFFVQALLGISTASSTFAGEAGRNGVCMDGSQRFTSYNNAQVLAWKTSRPNGWHGRGFVSGYIDRVVKTRDTHIHFTIKIGTGASDLLEVIYNVNFGALPELKSGTPLSVCGDFITATERLGQYPASPAGAILHWVHGAPSGRHEDGFVAIGGVIYGQARY